MSRSSGVIVVGAGVAGLTAACYTARGGQDTLLLERSHTVGGLVRTFWDQGFAFDVGARALENSGIIFPMLRELGIELPVTENPVTMIHGEHRAVITGPDGLEAYGELLLAEFPDHADEVRAIMEAIEAVRDDMRVVYGIDNPLFAEDMKDLNYLRAELLPWFTRYAGVLRRMKKRNEPVRAYLTRYTSHQPLIDRICQHFFKGSPAHFALGYFALYEDYHYPLGGTGMLTEALRDHAEALGATVRLGTEVTAVDAAAQTVMTADGETLRYDRLIWAADQTALYTWLKAPSTRKIRRQQAAIRRADVTDSVLTLFVALDHLPEGLVDKVGPHAFFTPGPEGLSALGPWDEALRAGREAGECWLDRFARVTTYELSVPVLRDPALAPEGKAGLEISTLADGVLWTDPATSPLTIRDRDTLARQILDVLDETLLPGIKEAVRFMRVATPGSIERRIGSRAGAISGWAFRSGDMPARHKLTHVGRSVLTPIPGVLQCGQWAFSPSGIPTCILTGKLAAERALKEAERSR